MFIERILVSDLIDEIAIKILDGRNITVDLKTDLTPEQLKENIKNYDAIIVRSKTQVTADVIEAGKRLQLIVRAGVGVDNIDVEYATKKKILVINSPGGNTIAAAELTCAMILNLSRKVVQASISLKSGVWDKKSFMGNEVSGKVLAIIGLGRVGREVARRMQAFGMKTIGYDPFFSAESTKSFGVETLDLEKIWPLADYITFHVPLETSTKNLINKTTLAKCKPGVKIINCARGGIIDEQALLSALQSGHCGGAGLDVFQEEPSSNIALLSHPLVVCTPHLGASTVEAQKKVAKEISLNILQLIDGKPASCMVNANQIK